MQSNSEVSYSWARQNLAELMDRILQENSITVISRRGHEPVAMLPAKELSSILETLHLLRSPVNAQRLFQAIARSESDESLPQSLEDLKAEIEKECE